MMTVKMEFVGESLRWFEVQLIGPAIAKILLPHLSNNSFTNPHEEYSE